MSINRKRKLQGLTLLEVMISLAVLSILAAGIYQSIQVTLQTTQELKNLSSQSEKISSLFELLNQTFRSLPQDARLSTSLIERQKRFYTQLQFKDSPQAFTFGDQRYSYGDKILGITATSSGQLSLELKTGDSPSIVLLDQIEKWEWSFWDTVHQDWKREWMDINTRPLIIKLTLKLAGESKEHVHIFELPQQLRTLP